MTQTNHTYTAGPADFRGPFSAPYCVRMLIPFGPYYLRERAAPGRMPSMRIETYRTLEAAQSAARADALRWAGLCARVRAEIIGRHGVETLIDIELREARQ